MDLKIRDDQKAWLQEYGGDEIVAALSGSIKELSQQAAAANLTYKEEAVVVEPVVVEAVVVAEPVAVEPAPAGTTTDEAKELVAFFAKDVVAPLLTVVKEQNEAIAAQTIKIKELESAMAALSTKVNSIAVDVTATATTPVSLMDTFKAFLFEKDATTGFGVSSAVKSDDPLLTRKPAAKEIGGTTLLLLASFC
jgi:hypothetical protein